MNLRKMYHWVKETTSEWEGFTRHFKANVEVFSRAVARARSSHLRAIAGYAGGNADSQRRRLQRFVKHPHVLTEFFRQWSQAIVQLVGQAKVTLIVDETKIEDRFGVMVVALAIEERAIPLAWEVYRANDKAAYPGEGQVNLIVKLLKAIQAGVPASVKVRVLADRGIGTSPALMRAIHAMGWQYLFRVTKRSKIVLADGRAVTFYEQVQQPGQRWAASGLVFKKRGRIPAHVRVLWGETAKDRWSLVTNDPTLTGWEYAERMWIEEAFRDLKSHGWQVEAIGFSCPNRLSNLWILLVVAYGWLLLWGYWCECTGQTARRRSNGRRRWSLFREGLQAFLTYSFAPD